MVQTRRQWRAWINEERQQRQRNEQEYQDNNNDDNDYDYNEDPDPEPEPQRRPRIRDVTNYRAHPPDNAPYPARHPIPDQPGHEGHGHGRGHYTDHDSHHRHRRKSNNRSSYVKPVRTYYRRVPLS